MRKAIGVGGLGVIGIALVMVLSAVPAIGGTCTPQYYIHPDLIAGKSTDAGDIEISHDTTNLYVKYVAKAPWYLSEVHLAVETSLSAIPQNKNHNPKNGQFEFSESFDPLKTEKAFTIPFADIDGMLDSQGNVVWCTELYIAAHAVVKKIVDGQLVSEQTGWGDGKDFGGNNWAMYINYCPGEPAKILNIPTGTYSVSYSYHPTSADGYWKISISIPDAQHDTYGYLENWHMGWCIETGENLGNTDTQDMELISSLLVPTGFTVYNGASDTGPVSVTQAKMNKVNWILTYYHNNAGYDWQEVQWAIWTTIGVTPQHASWETSDADWLVSQAVDTFAPKHGDYAAVILHSDAKQDCILEVDP